jgi:hypothetical protein
VGAFFVLEEKMGIYVDRTAHPQGDPVDSTIYSSEVPRNGILQLESVAVHWPGIGITNKMYFGFEHGGIDYHLGGSYGIVAEAAAVVWVSAYLYPGDRVWCRGSGLEVGDDIALTVMGWFFENEPV